jgi:hypothetical protein
MSHTGIIGLVLVNLIVERNVHLKDFGNLLLSSKMIMEEIEIQNDSILRVADLLEQMQDVNRMIDLHQGEND